MRSRRDEIPDSLLIRAGVVAAVEGDRFEEGHHHDVVDADVEKVVAEQSSCFSFRTSNSTKRRWYS